MIVDQHQPVVEKYYGSGKMLSVASRLLEECDRVVGSLIESWEEERSMERKVSAICILAIKCLWPLRFKTHQTPGFLR